MKREFRKAAFYTLAALSSLLPTASEAADSLVYAPDGRGAYTLRTGGIQLGGESAPIVFLNDKGNKNTAFVDAETYKASIQKSGSHETIKVTATFPMNDRNIPYEATFTNTPSSKTAKEDLKFSSGQAYSSGAGRYNFYDTSFEIREAKKMAQEALASVAKAETIQQTKQNASQYVGDNDTKLVIEGNGSTQRTHVTTRFYNPHLAGEDGVTLSYDLNGKAVDFVGLAGKIRQDFARVDSRFREQPLEKQTEQVGILLTESLIKAHKAYVNAAPEPDEIPEPGELGGIVIGSTAVMNMDHLTGSSLKQIELATNSAIVKTLRGKEANGLFLDRTAQDVKMKKRQQDAKREMESKALEASQREAKARAALAEKIRAGKATPAERETFDLLQKKLIEDNAKNPFAPHMGSSSKTEPTRAQKPSEPTGAKGEKSGKSQTVSPPQEGKKFVNNGQNGTRNSPSLG